MSVKGAFRTLGKVFLTANTVEDGGGLSALLVRKKLTGVGVAAVSVGMMGLQLADEGTKLHNLQRVGKVKYLGGPARMTGEYVSGAVHRAKEMAGDNLDAFRDLTKDMIKDSSLNPLESMDMYGVDGKFIAAMFNMGR